MSTYYDQISQAESDVDRLRKELAAAETRLKTLQEDYIWGIDVSSFQGTIDWAKVKTAGAGYVFCRLSDGDVQDPNFKSYFDASKAAGLLAGPYYFARVASAGNNERNGRDECFMALHFATRQGWGKAGDLRLAYDFETLNGQTAAKAAKHLMEFVTTYRNAMGHHPVLYTNPGTYNQVAPNLTATDKSFLAQCPLWVAHYGVSRPTVPEPWTGKWTMWQWTDTGSINGVTGNVDLNRTGISKTEFLSTRQ